MKSKSELRKEYLAKRMALSAQEFAAANKSILKHVAALDYSKVKYLHCFLSIENKQEIDTKSIIEYIKVAYPEIKIVVPKSDFKNGTLSHILLNEDTVLKENFVGIPEPLAGEMIDEKELDMIFVPMLVGDKQGNRIGYGKGFYDRFLQNCKPTAQKIGLSIFAAIEKIETIDPWDQRLNKLIYPKEIIAFS